MWLSGGSVSRWREKQVQVPSGKSGLMCLWQFREAHVMEHREREKSQLEELEADYIGPLGQ